MYTHRSDQFSELLLLFIRFIIFVSDFHLGIMPNSYGHSTQAHRTVIRIILSQRYSKTHVMLTIL